MSAAMGAVPRTEQILRAACSAEIFSGAAWSYGSAAGPIGQCVLGSLSSGGAPVTDSTCWDLASVTKPIVGLAVMSLVESGQLTLDSTVGEYLPAFAASDKAPLTVRQLLTHSSGIPGQVPLYRWCADGGEIIDAIRDLPVAAPPGSTVIYSSQGFILLGLIAEAASAQSLDDLVRARVTGPVGMNHTRFGLPVELREQAAATEDCPWRGRVVHGTVHDENAELLGGVAGHAGLFGPLGDLAALGQALCRNGKTASDRLLSPAALTTMIEPATDQLNLRRSLAWQGRDPAGCPAGDLMSARAYGHTGFTGPSIWVDPALGGYVVLLTNRVHPSRAERGFVGVRKAFHNAAVSDLSSMLDDS
jgi:CubicO group peptidase (beta-lactamase class C family)